jgi:hypothetical protein
MYLTANLVHVLIFEQWNNLFLVFQSPEVEPEVSLLLHVCASCRQYVVDLQVDKVEQDLRSEVKDKADGVISKLIVVDLSVTILQNKITDHMTKVML